MLLGAGKTTAELEDDDNDVNDDVHVGGAQVGAG
eukprot:CAMPEP_0198145978 /NCGR_PEP_ID=MMETSP1443-20131203/26631_1 /TAXON_ID=186043 /ORGANISM="Entomoneis sp., Strain CCMP2396" /LENGTH=33 /DNA_ID= /DNA_START= /DNA_END= /DNA_ORIENTATION=